MNRTIRQSGPPQKISRSVCWLSLALAIIMQPAFAGDWPQILGPQRNGEAKNERLDSKWPKSGPELLWSAKLGYGYAGPAVQDGRVVLFHRVDKQERVEAFDATTGKSLWQANFPAQYQRGINSDTGPRCVPVIHNNRVYLFGAAGALHCVSLDKGQTIWSRDAYGDLEGDTGYFGAGSTPIIAGDKLLINVGGKKSAGIVAFSLDTGKTVWQETSEAASYSSPTSTTWNGQPSVIFVTRLNCVGLHPETGREQFRFPFGMRGPTVNAATPLVFENQLFLSASYGIGAVCRQLAPKGTEEKWASDDVLSSQYATAVYRNGFLYGTHGREDTGELAELRCIEASSGKVRWRKSSFGVANLILADNKLLLVKVSNQSCELVLAEASSDRYIELANATIANETVRALPALSNGQLFLRTTGDTGGELKCWKVGTGL